LVVVATVQNGSVMIAHDTFDLTKSSFVRIGNLPISQFGEKSRTFWHEKWWRGQRC